MSNDHPSEREQFNVAWLRMCRLLRPFKEADPEAMGLAFSVLTALYSVAEIRVGIGRHAEGNAWQATPADIIDALRGQRLPSPRQLYGLAMTGDCILGAFIHRLITHQTLNALKPYEGVLCVEQHTHVITLWVRSFQSGELSDEDLRFLVGRKINPCGELCPGFPGVRPALVQTYAQRYQEAINQKALEAPPKDYPEPPMTAETRKKMHAKMREFMSSFTLRGATTNLPQKNGEPPL